MTNKTPPHIVTLILLSGLAALSMNVFVPALPSMAAYFDVDYRVMNLTVSAYMGLCAVVQVVVGPISDKVGRRPVILWSVGIFTVLTLGCIFATSATMFLMFRMGQAVVATTLALSRAAVRDVHEADKAASLVAYVTMGMALVPMFSPAIGGFLDRYVGWSANFWLLFALGGLVWLLVLRDFGETKSKSGLSLMQQIREYPELLRSPRFWGYTLAAGLSSGSFFAYLGGAPFVGTQVYGLSSDVLGMVMSAPAIGYFVGNFISGRYAARLGINALVLWGTGVNLFGVGLSITLAVLGMDSIYTFFGLLTFVGLGNGLAIPNATVGAISVRPHLAGSASGLSGAVMVGGGAVLAALAGQVLVEGSTAVPLLAIMCASGFGGMISILMVIRRERRLAAAVA